MAANSIPVASACIAILLFPAILPAQTSDEATTTTEASKVRIVRLSEVKGQVQLDRNTGSGYEPVMANLPIVEHSRLQTGTGVAEVEFEDNSTVRIAPNSTVEFTQLDRLPSGATVSSVRLVRGTAYISLLKTRGNEFNLLFGQQKIQLPPSTHIRLQINATQATLAVFDGAVPIDGPGGAADISRKKTATFNLLDQAQPTIAKDVVTEALDSWDKDAAAAHAQSVSNSAFGSPYTYGLSDMMYYGSFANIGGCGSIWRPYFASAAWSPYANGVWAWYPGAGYTWVSPYPWAWTPFHYGSWSYCAGAGWGWQPGGSWNGLNNTVAWPGATTKAGASPGSSNGVRPFPPRPIRPPHAGEPTYMVVHQAPLVRSEAAAGSFVFRRDSAGLGVPREGLGNLNKLSQSAVTHGAATTPVYFSAPHSAVGYGRPANGGNNAAAAGVGVSQIHRGYAPSPSAQSPSQSNGWNGGASPARSGASSTVSQPSVSYSPPASQSAPSPSPAPSAAPPSGGGPAPASNVSRGR